MVQHRLPPIPGAGSLALPRLAIEILRSGVLEGSFFLWKLRRLQEWLLDHFLLLQNAADGLVVDELGELEEEGVEDGGLVLFVGLGTC